jgi:diaminopimelate decarboxylase
MQVTSLQHFEKVKKLVSNDALKKCFFNTASLTEDVARKLIASSLHVVVDSLVQIELMNKAGRELGKIVPILIRLDTGIKVHNTPFGTSGAVLGLSREQAWKFVSRLSKYKWIEFRGIHNHAASQNTNLSSWKANMRALEKFIVALPHNIPLHVLNLGGGYPIPYVNATLLSVYEIFSQGLKPAFQSILKRFPDLQLVIEPGRFLVGPSGFLVATVTNLQPSKEINGAVVNASLFATFADRFLSKMTFQPTLCAQKSKGRKKYFIRGSSPASIDYFGIYSNLPELHVGDTLVFGMIGAYASSMGSTFSGVTKPPEYLLKEDALIRLA